MPLAQVYDPNAISIHAPREGCDIYVKAVENFPKAFQSTHPVRGATWAQRAQNHMFQISIHAPREGCDSFLS